MNPDRSIQPHRASATRLAAPIAFALVSLATMTSGCSSSSSADGTSGSGDTAPTVDAATVADSGVVGCSGEGDTYSANLVKPGKNGKYTFTLVQATPAPPSLDTNTWTVSVVDASGKAPTVDQLSALPYMPKMGHGSSQVPQFAAGASSGQFTISDVYLFMDGLWTVTVSVLPAGDGGKTEAVDSAVFTFCIDD